MEAMKVSSTAPRSPDGSGKGKKKDKGAATSKSGRSGQVEDAIRAASKLLKKAHARDSLHALPRFAEVVDGRYRIVSQPPVVVPLRELDGAWGLSAAQLREVVESQFAAYKSSLSADR